MPEKIENVIQNCKFKQEKKKSTQMLLTKTIEIKLTEVENFLVRYFSREEKYYRPFRSGN